MWWDDDGPLDEGHIRTLSLGEMVRRISPRMRPHRGALLGGVTLLLVSVAAELAAPLVLRRIIDVDIPGALKSGALSGILRSGFLYLGVFLVGAGASYTQIVVIARMGLETIARLKQDTFDHVLRLGVDYFDRNPPGRLMARVEADAERLQMLFSEVALLLLRSLILLGGTFTVMLLADARITLAVLGLTIPFFLGALLFVRHMRGRWARVRKLYTKLSTFVSEYVQAVPILQVYGRRPWAMRKLGRRNQERYRTEVGTEFLNYTFWSFFGTLEILAVMLILYVGFRGRFGETMTLGTLVLFVEYSRRLFWPLAEFAEQLNFVQKAFASADRVFGILETPSRVPDRPGAAGRIPRDWKELTFEDVSFVYPEGDEDEPDPAKLRALDGVSFQIRRGERLALVGPSGGGKTTITNLLLRFYQPTSGRITLDGVDIREYTQKAWRAKIGLVLQDIHLFPGTVAENLRVFSDGIPDAVLEHSVRVIGAEDVIERLDGRLGAPVAEGGQNLSMGERQLLCFSRAVVRDPELLILDEATSSVDPATERRIQNSLARMLEGRTSLIVAHRLSTVRAADRILVLQRGRLVQEGTHPELLRQKGLYRVLYDLQFKAGEVV
jgi:ATP-binding cassette subfamily B multidrug efflux pump